jgi:hypothetical protein
MDVWAKGQIKALNDVVRQNPAAANESIGLVTAGTRLYAYNATKTYYTTGSGTTWSWTEVTGTPASAPVGIVSDGKNVWIAYPGAIYSTTTSASSASSLVAAPSGSWTGIWFNKGKLFASNSTGIMYEISAGGTATAIINKSTLGFTWTSSTGVGGHHYFGGYNGDKSLIHKITLTADGTSLGAAIVAGELPDDEKVTHLDSYLGYLIIGTSKGIRFADTDTSGYITIGGLIETGQPVYCTEGQDRFVWFGWGNYDGDSSGLGRMDLSEFSSPLTPAYSSDLMAGWPALETNSETPTDADPVLADTVSVVTFNEKRVFAVKGKGVFAEVDVKVPFATLETGLISHGIIDNKYAAFLDGRLESLTNGNVMKLAYSADGGEWVVVGEVTNDGATHTGDFFIGKQGRNFEVRLVFGDIADSPLTGADITCTGILLRSYPAPKRVSKFSVPVLLFDSINVADRDWTGNPGLDFTFLIGLHKRQLPFVYQEGEVSYTVVMDDYQWLPEKRSSVSGFQGTFVAILREIL